MSATGIESGAGTDDNVPIEVYAAESPAYADIPFWVTACVRLAPPLGRTGKPLEAVDKVFPVVQAALADRMRVDQENIGLDRELISLIAGYSTTDQGRWIVKYLQRIGFLRVRKNYEPGTGKRSPDTFVASTQPPLGYVGPMKYAEIAVALRSTDPAARVLFVDPDGNSRSEPKRDGNTVGAKPYPRPEHGRGQNPRSEPRHDGNTVGAKPYPRPEHGRGQNPRSEPRHDGNTVADRGMERTLTGFSPSQSIDSGGSPGFAGPDAPPPDDTLVVARELVRRLPWRAKGHNLSMSNANLLAHAIAAAISRHGFTIERAQEIALAKLAESTSPRAAATYVIDGFNDDDKLLEPLADDSEVLPLPSVPANANTKRTLDKQASDKPSPLNLPACERCGACEGEPLAVRTVDDPETGTNRKCSCRSAPKP